MHLRKYQIDAVNSALDALTSKGSAVLQLPTASGKTITAIEIIRRENGVVWFIAHRREIMNQAAKAFTAAGLDFGIISPRHKTDYSKRIQIVSIGSLRVRLASMPKPSLVVWDECHHVAANTWAKIRDALDWSKHLGLTATPERLDGKGLSDWFAELVVGPSIETLVRECHLSKFKYFAPSEPDLAHARLQAGDYRPKDTAMVMNTPVLIGDAIREYKSKLNGKRAIVFATSIEASKQLADRFNDEGIAAIHIDGTTRDDVRSKAVDDLRTGAINVISNVDVFTEGVDVPKLDGVILMRPTKSPTLLLQMIGRALRKDDDKPEAVILDHAGLYHDHGWFAGNWHWSLYGGAAQARRKLGERGPRKCPECKEVRAERAEVCFCGYEFPTGREIGEFDGVLREIQGEVPDGYETFADFASRCGTTYKHVHQWSRHGMPHDSNTVHIETSIIWVMRNTRHIIPTQQNLESDADFAARFGFNRKVSSRWRALGMPSIKSMVLVNDALKWVEMNIDVNAARRRASFSIGRKKAPQAGYIKMNDFAAMIKMPRSTVHFLVKNGTMPSLDKHIPIREGLEWVRDNRPDIKIPPEAWPSDNDNESMANAA